MQNYGMISNVSEQEKSFTHWYIRSEISFLTRLIAPSVAVDYPEGIGLPYKDLPCFELVAVF